MALDDRDLKFEKALARHLRDDAQRKACPDAETLAAYHERTLSPEELNSWKKHIASCAGCQEVLVQLEATDEIPLGVEQHDKVVMMQLAEPKDLLEETPAAERSLDAGKATSPAWKSPPKARWRWFAPVGAVAAGLLVWVALHETNPAKLGETTSVQAPQLRREAASPAAPQAASGASSSNDLEARVETLPAELPSKERKSLGDLVARDKKAPGRLRVAPAPLSAAPLQKQPAAEERDAFAGNLSAANQPNNAPGVALEPQQREATPMAAPPAPQAALAGKSAPAPAAAAPQEFAKQKAAAQTAVMTEAVEVTSNFKDANALRMDAARNPRMSLVPGGKVAWRVGPVGLIERSTNGGKSWTPQASGVVTDLAAGSAPSKKVCWVVGRAGTILLTIDGGITWKQLTSPITDDLGGIRAADARHATIWDVANQQSYETRDAGITWTRIASE